MTRNQIFGVGVAVIVAFMAIGSFFSDEDRDYRYRDRDGFKVNVEIDVDDDEVVITSRGGNTVVHTKDGKIECEPGQDAITITRDDGSQTRIEC